MNYLILVILSSQDIIDKAIEYLPLGFIGMGIGIIGIHFAMHFFTLIS